MEPGRQLAHFTLSGHIGTGGMGEVWRARDTKLNRDVALKILPEAFADDAERMGRFQREAQALAALQHANIASIYGIEQDDDVTFLVMELCDGDDLSALIERGPVPVADAREIARQIARGLEEAHEKGIIHRDLKPANVKVSPEGRVKILDFGLARTFGDDQPATDVSGETLTAAVSMTRPGVVLGTAAYMSPEQARGKALDKRTDIWAFGVILYEMLTGKRLFAGETVSDVLASVLREEPDFDALPAELPLEMAWIIRRCLERDKVARLRDIGEARWLVGADASDSSLSVLAQPEPVSAAGARGKPRRNWLWPAVAAIAIGTVLIQFFSGGGTADPEDPYAVTGYRPLTPMNALAREGAMAPGGVFFVYTSVSEAGVDIFLQRGGGLNAINLTEDSPAADYHPSVSPDGQRIAFTSNREGKGIYVMGSTGESARLLALDGSRPAWSPDSREIVYSTQDFDVPWAREGQGLLRIVPADGGEPRDLDLDIDAVQPDWSPDGRRIAFWSIKDNTAQRDLWTVAADGSGLVALTDDPHLDWCPRWSPDGRWIYFLSNRSGMNNLWRLPIDPVAGRPLGDPEMATLPSPDVREFSFAPDGHGIVYSAVRQARNLHSVSMDPQRLVADGPVEPLLIGNFQTHSWGLSPDGRSVAFSLSGVKEDLFVVGTDGSRLRQLTDDSFRDRGPSWEADGQRILFYSDRGGRYNVWSIRSDGGDMRQLTDEEKSYWFPEEVPGGGFVTTHNDSGTFRLDWNADRTTLADPVRLVEGLPAGQCFFTASWSRDGRYLAGRTADNINSLTPQLAVYDRLEQRVIPIDLESSHWPPMEWAPDNRTVLVDVHEAIIAYDIVTGASHTVLPASAVPNVRNFAVLPDGSGLIVETNELESGIYYAEMGR